MRGAVMHGPGDVRVEGRDASQIVEATDAIIRVSAACVCGSDPWPYTGHVAPRARATTPGRGLRCEVRP